MTTRKTIIIPVSRLKLTLLTLGSLAFVVTGIYIIIKAFSPFQLFSVLGILMGSASIIFFGACFLFAFFRLIDKRPGLILSHDGFEDFSSFLGRQFIKWHDVKDVTYLQVQRQNFISVELENPKNIIEQTRGLKRFVMRMNYKFYGTPIHISANTLTYKCSKLHMEFYTMWKASR